MFSLVILKGEQSTMKKNTFSKKKIQNASTNNLKIIFCVGESLDDYKNGKTKNILINQLSNIFNKKL